jgi:hypothetical protein
MPDLSRRCEHCAVDVAVSAKFCPECGTALRPLRVSPPGAASPAAPGERAVARGRRLALVVGALAGLLALLALLAVLIGGHGSGADAAPTAAAAEQPSAEQECVNVWNRYEVLGKQGVLNMAEYSDVYVNVGAAEDFPDKCLITVASPRFDRTWQFLQAGKNSTDGPFDPPRMGSVGTLPPSAKQWNATLDDSGTMALL